MCLLWLCLAGQLMLHPAGMAGAVGGGEVTPLAHWGIDARLRPYPHALHRAGASPPEAACRAFVSWFHVAGGILLPFLVSIHCWQQSPAAASNLPGDPQLRGRWRATAAAAAACADAGLHGAVVGTAFATWHCLALAWLGAKAGAGLLA